MGGMPVPTKAEKAKLESLDAVEIPKSPRQSLFQQLQLPGFSKTSSSAAEKKSVRFTVPPEAAEPSVIPESPGLNEVCRKLLNNPELQGLAFSLGYHMGQQKQPDVKIPPEISDSPVFVPKVLPQPVDLHSAYLAEDGLTLPEIVKVLHAQDDSIPGAPCSPPKRKRRKRKQNAIGFAKIRNSKRIKVQTLSWSTGGNTQMNNLLNYQWR